MAPPPSPLCALIYLCVLSAVGSQRETAEVVVLVDHSQGNDSSCLSAQKMIQLNDSASIPCATINRALGNVACGKSSCVAPSRDQLNGVEIRLADGIHRLTGEQSLFGVRL